MSSPTPRRQPAGQWKTPTKLTRKPRGVPQKQSAPTESPFPTNSPGSKAPESSPVQIERSPSTDKFEDELLPFESAKDADSSMKGDSEPSDVLASARDVESDEEEVLEPAPKQSEAWHSQTIGPDAPEPIDESDEGVMTRVQDPERDASDVEEADDGGGEKLAGQDLSVPNLTFTETLSPWKAKSPEVERQSNPSEKIDSPAAPSEGIPASTETILALHSQAKNRTMALLRGFEWQDGLKSEAIAIDDGALRLSFWAHDLQIDREASQLADYEYDERLFGVDEFGLRDVAEQAREVQWLMERDPRPEEWEVAMAVDEYDRAVKSLTKSAAAHQALLDSNGEVAALRARLQAIEDSWMEDPRAENEVDQDLNQPSEGRNSIIAPEAPASPPPAMPDEEHNQQTEYTDAAPAVQNEARPVTVKEAIRMKIQTAILNVFDEVLDELFQKEDPVLDNLRELRSLPSIKSFQEKIISDAGHIAGAGGKPWEVNERGEVVDAAGNVVGRLVEGEAEALGGYPCNDDGEILNDDGDLVGRYEAI